MVAESFMDLRILQRNGSDRLDVYYKEDLLIRLGNVCSHATETENLADAEFMGLQ